MALLSKFSACGILFGLTMPLAAVVALGLCLWASLKPGRRGLARLALTCSLGSLTLGLDAALTWLALAVFLGRPGAVAAEVWLGTARIFLAGLAVSFPSLVWSLALLRNRRGTA
jgi:hypothetical protein